jgi:hypothetical protein
VKTLGWTARLGPVVGLGLLGWLGWALGARIDYWQARSYFLLLLAAGVAAVVGTASAAVMRKRAPPVPRVLFWLRRLLWAALLGALCWCIWPASRALVGYAFRQVPMMRFH